MRTKTMHKCPACGLNTHTVYSKKINESMTVRRHKCDKCEYVYVIVYDKEDPIKTLGYYMPKEAISLKAFLKNA